MIIIQNQNSKMIPNFSIDKDILNVVEMIE
jgi:hypothetical protein